MCFVSIAHKGLEISKQRETIAEETVQSQHFTAIASGPAFSGKTRFRVTVKVFPLQNSEFLESLQILQSGWEP